METPKIHRDKFVLENKEWITPHMIRITLKGDVQPYKNCIIGVNNKIFVPPMGQKKVHFSETNPETGELILPPEEVRPSLRTYTHRGIDVENNHLIVDFVNHGDNGPASSWALHAEIGDELGVAMKLKDAPLHPQADWYFLIGDATALPVISCILEALPKNAKGKVLLEIPTKEDEQLLVKPDGIDISWIYNEHPENGSELVVLAKQIELPSIDSKFAYVAAEFAIVKELREYFRKELEWSPSELYAYSYWKAGVAEDKSTPERQEEKRS
ncbi:siderophore-interacting protein [Empedobacter falsenii]|uniref:siderophore-interacting protein n=1 Tax=Empedobacter falsenii TaxID=343874 RepID=UPI0025783A76|nr:siderophore-interacting protein [Empedobacter falsenii]MDM1063932.1 siderophore-interacting protein [Empedobacter falsenii]MDM1547073.1 siderophore-interacting protein [Empedobacter falsenii]